MNAKNKYKYRFLKSKKLFFSTVADMTGGLAYAAMLYASTYKPQRYPIQNRDIRNAEIAKANREAGQGISNVTKKTGADRASQYSAFWGEGSVEDAVNKFAPNTTPTYTDKGKIIFRNDSTGIEVVYDRNGDYFRIVDTNLLGKRTALDLNGNKIPNNTITEKGTQRGISQNEYNVTSHFKTLIQILINRGKRHENISRK